MGQIKSKPKNPETCLLCHNLLDKNTQIIIEPCKHKLCKPCTDSYNYSINYKVIFCPLCNNNYRNNPV
jgi:hypothetical protein